MFQIKLYKYDLRILKFIKNRQDFLTKRMAADKKSAYQLLCPENKAYYADMQRDIDKIWVVVLVYYLRLVVSSCFCHSIIV